MIEYQSIEYQSID